MARKQKPEFLAVMPQESENSTLRRPPLALVQQTSFGDRLRSARRSKRMTQSECAEEFGVRAQTVSAWESGTRPQRRFFAQIADFLHLPDSESVELLLTLDSGANSGSEALRIDGETEVGPAAARETWPENGLKADVIRAVTRQLLTGKAPTPRQMALFDRLLNAVGADLPLNR